MDIVTRPEWGATAPLGTAMRLPADELWVHHSVTAPDDVVADMLELERIGVSRFGRFSYSYAVHPSGAVAEGAGLTVGAHTAGRNSHALGVVAIGNYQTEDPSDEMLEAIAQLTVHLIAEGALKPGIYPTGGHREAPGASTVCPGWRLHSRLPEIRARIDELQHPVPEDPAVKYRYPSGQVVELNPPPVYLVDLGQSTVGVAGNGNLYPTGHGAPSVEAAIAAVLYRENFHDRTVPTMPVWDGHTLTIVSHLGEVYAIPISFPTPPQTVDPGIVARCAACEQTIALARVQAAELVATLG